MSKSGPSTHPTFQPQGLAEYLQTIPFLGSLSCTHNSVEAGSLQEILIDYVVGSSGIADGATVKLAFRFYSDWALFQTKNPSGSDYISAEFHPRESFPGESPATVRRLLIKFDQKGHERPYQKAILIHLVDGYARPGDRIKIRLGDRRFGGPGTRVQTFAEERFTFRAFVDTAGTSRLAAVPGDILLNIHPGPPQRIVATNPRVVRTQTPWKLHLRLEDRWGNACRDLGSIQQLHFATGAGNPASLPDIPSFQIPAQGWATVSYPGQPLPVPGDYRFRISHASLPPVDVLLSAEDSIPSTRALFADLHVHSNHTVGTNDNPWNFHYGRDVAGLDIFGYTANDFQITPARWQEAVQTCRALTRDGEFVAFPGTEWNGNSALGGDRNVVFLGDSIHFPLGPNGQNLRSCDWNEDTASTAQQTPGASPISQLWEVYGQDPENHLMIPHVGGRRVLLEWHHPELERLVEVASAWGHFPWILEDALQRGYQVGVCANGDEHRGRPGGGAPGVGVFGVHGGLTGVWSDGLNPAQVGSALRQRHTWACYGGGSRAVALFHAQAASGPWLLQGDVNPSENPPISQIRFSLFGDPADGGWEQIELRSEHGTIWERNLHRELGFGHRLRIGWCGARIPDRYRWAEWRGTLTVRHATVRTEIPEGLEHPEEFIRKTATSTDETTYAIQTDTYGDRDSLVLLLESLETVELELHLAIGGYAKTAEGGQWSPDPDYPPFTWRIGPEEIRELSGNPIRRELGGQNLHTFVERLTDQPLPNRVDQTLELEPANRNHRALYLWARQLSGATVITSPVFQSGQTTSG